MRHQKELWIAAIAVAGSALLANSNFGFTSAAPAIAGNLNGWEGEHLMVGVRQVGQPATNQYFTSSPPQVQ